MPSQALVAVAKALSVVSLALATQQPLAPSIDTAAQRGSHIFNAVFDSLRKYGSTIHPNGMSLYLATVPQGVLFHHGNGHNSTPTTLDWLAYEIEHAEIFARPNYGGRPGGPSNAPPHHDTPIETKEHFAQAALGGGSSSSGYRNTESIEVGHGWLHTYRTTRPLQFLYIDGMSGDKGSGGVADTQDYLLRAQANQADPTLRPQPTNQILDPKPTEAPPGPPGEFARAEDLCRLCAEWQLQGVIRTEGAGTEIIKCDFFDGLEEVQSLQRSDNAKRPGGEPGGGGGDRPGGRPGGPGGPPRRIPGPFNVENGFRDVGAHRTTLDYSSMVSAFFFPINLTNPDEDRAGLPRLISVTTDELVAIKTYLTDVVVARRGAPLAPYNWRDVTDLVVRRYAPRLVALANISSEAKPATAAEDFADGVLSALTVFMDYSVVNAQQREAEARARCVTFYLQNQEPPATDADRLIYAGFEAVNAKICGTLFDALKTVSDVDADGSAAAVATAKASVKQLIAYLDWSVFENCLGQGDETA